jgi:PIN domain nuclease of toxin-antitoxin system
MVVFDSWALLAFLGAEDGAERIQSAWVAEGAAMSSINLGEVLYVRMRAVGEEMARADVEEIKGLIEVVDPDWTLVVDAARIKADGGLSFADAFCVATALSLDAPLWTGDPEIVTQASRQACEVVDLRG